MYYNFIEPYRSPFSQILDRIIGRPSKLLRIARSPISQFTSANAPANMSATTTPSPILPPPPPKRSKLTGRAFYESLGSPKYVLAPMVDQSEFVCSYLTSTISLAQSNPLPNQGMASPHPIFPPSIPAKEPSSLHPHAARPPLLRNAILPRPPFPATPPYFPPCKRKRNRKSSIFGRPPGL